MMLLKIMKTFSNSIRLSTASLIFGSERFLMFLCHKSFFQNLFNSNLGNICLDLLKPFLISFIFFLENLIFGLGLEVCLLDLFQVYFHNY